MRGRRRPAKNFFGTKSIGVVFHSSNEVFRVVKVWKICIFAWKYRYRKAVYRYKFGSSSSCDSVWIVSIQGIDTEPFVSIHSKLYRYICSMYRYKLHCIDTWTQKMFNVSIFYSKYWYKTHKCSLYRYNLLCIDTSGYFYPFELFFNLSKILQTLGLIMFSMFFHIKNGYQTLAKVS